MKLHPTPIPGAYVIELSPRVDERGFFARAFCARTFRGWGLIADFPQMNLSMCASRGTIRGLHYQLPPAAEAKLIRCVRGAIQDVFVDLRQGSPTFLKWHSEVLTSASGRMVYVPPGCAHGYQALEDGAEALYQASAEYSPEMERQVHYADPRVGVVWAEKGVIVSPKDAAVPPLPFDYQGVSE